MIWYYNHISQGPANLLIQMIMHVVNSAVFIIMIASFRSSAIRIMWGLRYIVYSSIPLLLFPRCRQNVYQF